MLRECWWPNFECAPQVVLTEPLDDPVEMPCKHPERAWWNPEAPEAGEWADQRNFVEVSWYC
jgi:hypothetical protein